MQAAVVDTPSRDSFERRQRFRHLDFVLLLGTLGLVACSLYTIGTATAGDIEGSRYYYVIRQGIYAGVGFVAMLVVASFDYSRLRELKVGIYATMVVSILLVFALASATRG